MFKRLLLIGLFFFATPSADAQIVAAFVQGPAASSPALLTIDGAVSATPADSATQTMTLSTTKTNDVIIAIIKANNTATVSSITDGAGLTWAKRKQYIWAAGSKDIEEWYAVSSGILTSDIITVNWSGTATGVRMEAYGINGANTTTPFDANGGLPYTGGLSQTSTPTTTITTSHADDMIITSAYWSSGSLTTRPTGYTQVVASGGFADVAYKVVSATQSSVVVTYTISATDYSGMITDAVQAP